MIDQQTPPTPRLVGNAALARYLGVTPMTIWRWKRQPDLHFPPTIVINGVSYNSLNEIDAWLREHRVDYAAKKSSSDQAKPKVSPTQAMRSLTDRRLILREAGQLPIPPCEPRLTADSAVVAPTSASGGGGAPHLDKKTPRRRSKACGLKPSNPSLRV